MLGHLGPNGSNWPHRMCFRPTLWVCGRGLSVWPIARRLRARFVAARTENGPVWVSSQREALSKADRVATWCHGWAPQGLQSLRCAGPATGGLWCPQRCPDELTGSPSRRAHQPHAWAVHPSCPGGPTGSSSGRVHSAARVRAAPTGSSRRPRQGILAAAAPANPLWRCPLSASLDRLLWAPLTSLGALWSCLWHLGPVFASWGLSTRQASLPVPRGSLGGAYPGRSWFAQLGTGASCSSEAQAK